MFTPLFLVERCFPCILSWVPPVRANPRLHDPSRSRQSCFLKGPWTCYLPCPARLNFNPPGRPPSFFFLTSPFCGLSFPTSWSHWNNWTEFSVTRFPLQLLNGDIKSSAMISLWLQIFSLCHSLPPSAVVTGLSSWLYHLFTMKLQPWYIIIHTSTGLELCL